MEGRIEMDGESEYLSEGGSDRQGSYAASGGGASTPAGERRATHRSLLERTIIREIVPRLVLAHSAAVPSRDATHPDDAAPAPGVARLVGLVLAPNPDAPGQFLAERREAGASVDALYVDLLAPVARHLGWLWDEDRCDFARVTLGMGRLHQLVRDFSGEPPARELGRRCLFVPAPGDQHSLGLAMVTELFRRGGWTVWSGRPQSVDELLGIVRREWFAMVGFSLGSDTKLDALAGAIRRVRRASRNRALGVMVGGPLFVAHPELVALVGADATAADGRQALQQAQALITLLARAA